MICSLVASGPNSADMRPRRITTTMRCDAQALADLRCGVDDSHPCLARSASSLKTSALAPMSMPRLGSSRRRTSGSVASILPMTTFCWLPPESEPIGAPPPSVLMAPC